MTLLRPNFSVLFACILFSTAAQAESVAEIIKKQGLAPEMEKMMHMMFDSMCTSIVAPYVTQTKDAGLESMANACMSSIESMNCDKLISGGADNSQACVAFEKAAKQAGIDTNTTTIIQ